MSSYRHKSFISSKKRKNNIRKKFDSPAKRRLKKIACSIPQSTETVCSVSRKKIFDVISSSDEDESDDDYDHDNNSALYNWIVDINALSS